MKTGRLLSIILTLLDNERISAQELATMFEVSVRTIYRDIDTINMAGIPVRSISGVGGGFEIMPNYKMDKQVFSTADLTTILTALSALSEMMQGSELANALAKVKSFIPRESVKEIELKTGQLHIDLHPWLGNKNIQTHLEQIKIALQEHKLFSFHYSDRYGNQTKRTIEPYQLILKSQHWYVQGYCKQRNAFRLFKLSRLLNAQIQENHFKPRDYEKPQLDFTNFLTMMQTEINLRIHTSILDRVLDFCPYENIFPDGNHHYFVHFPFIENDFYYSILLGFGTKCECIGPAKIRAELKRRIHDIAMLYETSP